MMNFIKNIAHRLSWRANLLTIFEMMLLLATYPLMIYANPQWFVEDGIAENLQLLVCLWGLAVAFLARYDKPLFIFICMLIVLMICREISTGRHWLCAYNNLPYNCDWSEFRFGMELKWLRNLFTIATVIYFFGAKVYRYIWQYVQKAPIYVWEILFIALGIILALLAEKPFDNEIMEEMAETLLYTAILNLIYRYSHNHTALN